MASPSSVNRFPLLTLGNTIRWSQWRKLRLPSFLTNKPSTSSSDTPSSLRSSKNSSKSSHNAPNTVCSSNCVNHCNIAHIGPLYPSRDCKTNVINSNGRSIIRESPAPCQTNQVPRPRRYTPGGRRKHTLKCQAIRTETPYP